MASRKLTFNDFVSIISMRTGLKEDTVKRVYKKMIELIEEEIRIHGEVHLQDFGTVKSKIIPGGDRYVPRSTGGSVKRYCAPTLTMSFMPSVSFKKRLNEMIIQGHDEYTKNMIEEIEKNKGLNSIRDRLDELFDSEEDSIFGSEYYNNLMEEDSEDGC